jgi:hypothetical protein
MTINITVTLYLSNEGIFVLEGNNMFYNVVIIDLEYFSCLSPGQSSFRCKLYFVRYEAKCKLRDFSAFIQNTQ